ncbi:unnamed protein product [Staurois parvus]|uniref:Uncharacterized protein n=1 Tax=Staurois parvus TaxID=386267 RepID=A0ABN9FZU5_9NEOB|nr:unnamed protein product [Staurois parvus]
MPPSVLPISATYQCQSVPPISVHQKSPISARQCCLSVPPNSASQCRLSVHIGVLPFSAHQ